MLALVDMGQAVTWHAGYGDTSLQKVRLHMLPRAILINFMLAMVDMLTLDDIGPADMFQVKFS